MNSLAIKYLELSLSERWRHLVLNHLHTGFVAHYLIAIFDSTDAADV